MEDYLEENVPSEETEEFQEYPDSGEEVPAAGDSVVVDEPVPEPEDAPPTFPPGEMPVSEPAAEKGKTPAEDTAEEEEELLPEETYLVNFEELLKTDDLESLGFTLLEKILGDEDMMKKDILDRFLDFVFFKVQTGNMHILNMAYPTKKMRDEELEGKIIELINEHLYPEIIFRLLKVFTRNVHNSDTNLYIANLIKSEDIIRSIFETFKLLKKDIFISDPKARTMNVKRIQQFPARSEDRLSSPLDICAILKYILEFFMLKYNLDHIYTRENIQLSGNVE